jgi:cytosine permease
MPAEIMAASFHLPYWSISVLLGVIFVLITVYGIKGMNLISNISVPFFIVLLFIAFIMIESHHPSGNMVHAHVGDKTMTFSEVLAGVLASFADSGTLAPDFNRWAKDRKTSWISVFSAFPVGFGIAMIAGVLFTVLLSDKGLVFDKPFQTSNPIGYMIVAGGGALTFAVLVAAINQGSNATHCLYNSGVGFSKLFGKRYVFTTSIIGILGIIIAATGVWALLIDWLKIIGVLVPPIGAVIIVSYYTGIYSKHSSQSFLDGNNKWHKYPWVALVIGWFVGFVVNFTSLCTVIPVPVASFFTSLLIIYIASKKIRNTPLTKRIS